MRIYASSRRRMASQLGSDLFVLAWVVACAWASRALGRAVESLAGPARRTGEMAGELSQQMSGAQQQVQQVPGVGDQLSQPFGGLAGGLQQIVTQSQAQANGIHHLAQLLTVVAFVLPVVAVVARWLPRRVRFVREASAAQRLVDSDADLDLFALRAMANLSLPELARITDDPVGQWRAGNRDVVARLAALELHRSGLSVPPALQPADRVLPRD